MQYKLEETKKKKIYNRKILREKANQGMKIDLYVLLTNHDFKYISKKKEKKPLYERTL